MSFGLLLFKTDMSRYSNRIMDDATLLAQKDSKLKQELSKRKSDHEALLNATQTLVADRDQLANRVQELEAMTKRLTDMLWGRRSEQRGFDPNQLALFAKQPAEEVEEPTPEEEAEAIVDEELIKQWEDRRRQRRTQPRSEAFPEHMERRERTLDLPDDEKAGLTYIGDAISERMRFDRPHAYIERIIRRRKSN